MSEIQARVKVPRGIFVHSVKIKNQQFHRRTQTNKINELLYNAMFNSLLPSVFYLLPPYPLPLEYLLPPVCHSNEALLETAKNTKSYYCTTLTFSHDYLDWKMETLRSNDNILLVNDLIGASSEINSSSL